jgi:hypothetical protein
MNQKSCDKLHLVKDAHSFDEYVGALHMSPNENIPPTHME